VILKFGSFAPFQLCVIFVINLCWILYAAQTMAVAFIAESHPFTCVWQNDSRFVEVLIIINIYYLLFQNATRHTHYYDNMCGIDMGDNRTLKCNSSDKSQRAYFEYDASYGVTIISEVWLLDLLLLLLLFISST
jgi:hypothetical protein